MKDIVEDCGVNRNSFYYHFQDIPSLLEEIIVEMTAKVIENLPEESTFEEKVTAALQEINLNKRMIYHIYGSSNREFYEKQLMKICEHVTCTYIRSRVSCLANLLTGLIMICHMILWNILVYFAECLQEVCVWYVKNIKYYKENCKE